MRNADKIREILFLTYLTNYNIKDIYHILEGGWLQDIKQYLCEQKYSMKGSMPTEQELNSIINKANQEAENALESLIYYQITPIPYFSKEYPINLKVLKDFPPLLFTKGKKIKSVSLAAVVGTRDISHHADRITSKIVSALIEKGYGIVSGLALGIDTLAHQRAVECKGYTIAVLPTPLETVYPKENIGLVNKILDSGGAIVSELASNINRGKKSFVERNRIQTALSEIVIPIEMSAKSGTMHTINFGKQQKKAIYILQPAPQQAALPQYGGIVDLIAQQQMSPRKNVCIVKDMTDFRNRLDYPRHPQGTQITIFSEDR